MADNPLDDSDPERQERIRVRAYHLWEAEGRPDGHSDEYWERAEELIGMEENPQAGTLPNPMLTGEDPDGVVIEEAFIQDNLGEFPDRFADQGEVRQTPMAKMPTEDQPARLKATPAKAAEVVKAMKTAKTFKGKAHAPAGKSGKGKSHKA